MQDQTDNDGPKKEQKNVNQTDVSQKGDVPVDTPENNKGKESIMVEVDIADFEAKLSQAEAKLLELQDSFLRAKADAENTRRRAQEDISKAHKFAIESFAESLIPVKDSLEMALKIETQSVESLKEGAEATLRQLTTAFEKNRLVEINPVRGDKLNPSQHQAVSMVPADQEANTIVEVLQKGYTISERLLRPALVTVAQSK